LGDMSEAIGSAFVVAIAVSGVWAIIPAVLAQRTRPRSGPSDWRVQWRLRVFGGVLIMGLAWDRLTSQSYPPTDPHAGVGEAVFFWLLLLVVGPAAVVSGIWLRVRSRP